MRRKESNGGAKRIGEQAFAHVAFIDNSFICTLSWSLLFLAGLASGIEKNLRWWLQGLWFDRSSNHFLRSTLGFLRDGDTRHLDE